MNVGNPEHVPDLDPAVESELREVVRKLRSGEITEAQLKETLRELFSSNPELGVSFAEGMRQVAKLKDAPWPIRNWQAWLRER